MARQIVILRCCLVVGVQMAVGVRTNIDVDLEPQVQEALDGVDVFNVLQDPQQTTDVCENGETPPNHVDDLVGKLKGDPQFLYKVLTQGFLGYTEMMTELKKNPPQVTAGYSALSVKLWKVVTEFIDKADQDSVWMTNAKTQWDKGWDQAPDIDAQIRDFQQTGRMTTLVSAVADITATALSVASSSICVKNVSKVFDGIGFLVHGIGNATVAYARGRTMDALEFFWNGVNGSVYVLTTEEDRNATGWGRFYSDLELRASEFFEFVIEWEEEVLKSDICRRASTVRPHKPATYCPNGYTWDQISLCMPDKDHGANCSRACPKAVAAGGGTCQTFCGDSGEQTRYCCRRDFGTNKVCLAAQYTSVDGGEFTDASNYFQCVDPVIFGLLQTGSGVVEASSSERSVETSLSERSYALGERSSLDRSAARKCFFGFCWGKAEEKIRDEYGARQAECDPLSLYPELSEQGKCSPKCTNGWSVDAEQPLNCISDCTDPKIYPGKLGFTMGTVSLKMPVCGLSETHLAIRNADLAMLAINTVGAVQNALIAFLAKNDVSDASLNGIIAVMKDVALTFAIPQCSDTSTAM